jgi:3-hydroxyisobutyrate dehydrogenase-like beta-hydroxyacid dehydrogenase
MFQLRGPMMVKNDYSRPTMKVAVWKKDMQVIGDYAKKIGVKVPVFSATAPIYDKALHSGYAQQDTAAVCAVLEKMAGLRR